MKSIKSIKSISKTSLNIANKFKNFYQINYAIRITVFFLAGLFCQFTPIHAQVTYTDIVPDAIFKSNGQNQIDINNDGETDFTFKGLTDYSQESETFQMLVMSSQQRQVAVLDGYPSVFYAGDTIKENLPWSAANSWLYLSSHTSGFYNDQFGNWVDVSHGFLGIKVKIDGLSYYGWIRLAGNETVPYKLRWILDFGINTEANKPILAGQALPPIATSVFAKDIYNYFDGRDIRVSFTQPHIDSVFSEFRLVVAKANDTSAYNLDVMNQLPDSLYKTIFISSGNKIPIITQVLNEETLDKDGDTLDKFFDYRIHLLNISSNGNPNDNKLSDPSPMFYLQAITNPVNTVVAYDNGDSNNSEDIKVSFPKLENESFLKEYRIFIAPDPDTIGFDVQMALSLSSEYYTLVQPTVKDIDVYIDPEQKDILGNPIYEGIFYQVVVLSLADSIYSVTSTLSEASRKFILNNPDFFRAGQKIGDEIKYFLCDSLFSDMTFWDWSNDGSGINIDLNRDGLDDFKLIAIYNDSPMQCEFIIEIKAERNNLVLKCIHAHNWIDVLEKNETISEDYNWINETAILAEEYRNVWSAFYYFHGHITKSRLLYYPPYYIGFCIMDNEEPQYAWLQLSGQNFVDYAFQDFNSVLPEIEKEKHFKLYPNPSNNYFYFECKNSGLINKNLKVKIYNAQGVIIDEFTFTRCKHKYIISNYTQGIYFYQIFDGKQFIETNKFIAY